MTKKDVWTWIVRNEIGGGTHKTRWKLTEADARATFGERVIARVESSLEHRQVESVEIQPGYMSRRE